jgi:hypothetical protein
MAEGIVFDEVAPVVPVRDLDAALERYRRLGFAVEAYGGGERYGYVRRGRVQMHLTEDAQHGSDRHGAVVYLFVSDADALYDEWKSASVDGRLVKPRDTPYGLREFAFVDTDDTVHRVGSPLNGQ